MSDLLQIAPTSRVATLAPASRARLEGRARRLAWGGIAWHFVEFAIAIAAGVAANSIALVAFGGDSLIEAVAGFVVVWLFTGSRLGSHTFSAPTPGPQSMNSPWVDGDNQAHQGLATNRPWGIQIRHRRTSPE